MLLIHQSPHVRQSLLAQPITLDDFVAVVHVSINAATKHWVCHLLSDDTGAGLTLTNLGVGLVWDSQRKEVGAVRPLGNGDHLLRIERTGDGFTLTTQSGTVPMVDTGDGIDGPISFDLIGGMLDTPGCHVLAAVIMPGHPTAEDVARVEVGLAGYQLS